MGALLALMLCGMEFDIVALIGIVLLIGIVKKNAIMMIDFALEAEREEKLSPDRVDQEGVPPPLPPDHDDQLRRAARRRCRWRSRAGPGASSASRSGSASWAGCSISQVLTLYTTPVIYLYMERFGRWVAGRRRPARRDRARGGSGVSAGGETARRRFRAGGAGGTAISRGAASISEPFIRRPIGTSLLAAAIILLGASCLHPAAGGAAAAGRPAHHLGQCQPSRGEPGDDVVRGGHPARAPAGPHRRAE